MITFTLVVGLVAVLAFVNGANDNSKGVATLVGFGSATPQQALTWAMITTAVGAGVSFWIAGGLIAAFKAKLFQPGTPVDGVFFVAVLVGAVLWVAIATRTGMPVSTTHAIVGGLIGAGMIAFGPGRIVWAFVGRSVAVPLLLGPVISTLLVYLLAGPARAIARRYAARCVCVSSRAVAHEAAGGVAVASVPASSLAITAGAVAECQADEPAVAVTSSGVATFVHWASSGLVGFARGWNDAPKIAALGIVALAAGRVGNPAAAGYVIVTVAMASGGYFAGRKVLETLANNLTPLPLAESLTASLTTAALVSAASWASMPVSTTHVSTGAIIGAGLKNDPGQVRWGKVSEIAFSWVITLPVAGIISAVSMWLITRVGK